jgi:hypothetical protein
LNAHRSTTLSILRRSQDPSLLQSLQRATQTLATSLVSLLSLLTGVASTHSHFQLLQGLVENAVSLSRLMKVQRAVIRTFQFSVSDGDGDKGTWFDAKTMEDIGHNDDDSEDDDEADYDEDHGADHENKSVSSRTTNGAEGPPTKDNKLLSETSKPKRRKRKRVQLVVFPGVVKRGDEMGEHVDEYTNVLTRTKVLCEVVLG